jgi:hypothetical protein
LLLDFTAAAVKGFSFAFFWRNNMIMRFALSGENWRSPLRVIDSFLPPAPEQQGSHTLAAHRWMARFTQAGWLSPASQPASLANTLCTARLPVAGHTHDNGTSTLTVHSHPNGLRISGRMADVCAELDRLAQLEARQPKATRH